MLLAAIFLPFSFAHSGYSKEVKVLTATNFEADVIKNEVKRV